MMSIMMMVRKGFRYLTDSGYRMGIDTKRGKYTHLSDLEYITLRLKKSFKRNLDLMCPQTFNEKLQWLKLYDRQPVYTRMVDKFAAKQYVAERLGLEYIIPTLGVWNSFEEIDFSLLPNQFVLKCTHDSGSVVVCKDKEKFDREKACEKLSGALTSDFYSRCREWPYKNVQKKIIAEQYMQDDEFGELRDYKVHNFNGEPKFILVCGNRFRATGMTEDFYTTEWEHMPVRRPWSHNAERLAEKPDELRQILEFARILSNGIPFVRTDFYIINHKIFFGELTFYPASGFLKFVPPEFDKTFGQWLTLPESKG